MIFDLTKRKSGSEGGYTAEDWLDASKPVGSIVDNTHATFAEGLLQGRTGITRVELSEATAIPSNLCLSCSNLAEISAPKATSLGASCLRGGKFEYLVLPKVGKIAGQYPFHDNSRLKAVDLGGEYANSSLKNMFMANKSNYWTILVLRSSIVWALDAVSAFTYSRFASGGAGGTLYVPASLVSTYQSATNWSTLLGYPNNQIKSIESTHTDPDAPIDLTLYYADGTPIPTT